jgi:folate-dependent phosphoribosylglycinamide formyltransferase PurN
VTSPCIVLLAGDGAATRIVYNALRARFGADVRLEVIIEEPVSRVQLLRRRAARLGVLAVLGQILFMALAQPLLRALGRGRIEAIKSEHGLDDSPLPEAVHRVASANAPESQQLVRSIEPTVVVVNGTRILSRETIDCVNAPFVNMHVGITPAYRGVHGGYWALAEGRPDMVGTTIHYLDDGIDTGGIIEQRFFERQRGDTFASLPYQHLACGVPALLRAIDALLRSERPTIRAHRPGIDSRLHYHPTLWGYLAAALRKGAW